MTIPPYNPIKVGTQVGVNYAGYHLPPWCYFRNSWRDLGDLEDEACNNKLKHTGHTPEEVAIEGMGGEEDMFLSRAHEFQRADENGYKYHLYGEDVAHHLDAWTKFASDDNEELLPPTMSEERFGELKVKFGQLLQDCGKEVHKDSKTLKDLSEYEFDELFHELKSSLPSEAVVSFLREIAVCRREQEEVLIKEIHRRIEEILNPEKMNFRSVLERKVEHDKEVDRVVRSLFAHKMRVDVRMSEIENIEVYLGLREKGDNNDLLDILARLREKIGAELVKLGGKDREEIEKEIDELEEFYLKTEPGKTPVDSEFRKLIDQLKEPYEHFKDLKDNLPEIFNKHKTEEGVLKWEQLKDTIMDSSAEDKRDRVEHYLEFLRALDIIEVQDLERDMVSIRKEVDTVITRVKRVANDVQQRVDKLLKEEKTDAKRAPQKQLPILSFKPKLLKSPFTVDDLNIYLRYPPIKNRLVYHEGNWPPLRAVQSEITVSVQEMEREKKEYRDIKLSNVIGSFDEAFTLFSSTLADHGMPRPTPLPRPIRFRYGMGEVVPALDHSTKGVSDMKLGEIRIMVCPSRTCYGERGVPDSVPPHMPLIYVVRMSGIYTREDENYESDDDMPSDQSDSQDEDVTA